MIKDHVCIMPLDIEMAAASSEYNGNIYYFCSLDCKKAFDEKPFKYIGGYVGQWYLWREINAREH